MPASVLRRTTLTRLSIRSYPSLTSRVTPNLDALASKSLVLRRNYCQQAICGPTRASLLTSRRPDRTKVWDLSSYWRVVGGNYTTIPQLFKERGYLTIGMGKIFHPGTASGGSKDDKHESGSGDDMPYSWSKPCWHAPNLDYWGGKKATGREFHPGESTVAVPPDVEAEHPLPDSQIADHAVATLEGFDANDPTPFFLGVGFHRPHLPFIFPARLLKNYPNASIALPNQQPPAEMPTVAWSDSIELKEYHDLKPMTWTGEPGTTLPQDKVLALRQGYYAAVTHMDECLGQVMAALNRSSFVDNTVVAFWGDHGWQLGEHGEWAKITNWEYAVHSPLLIHDPSGQNRMVVSDQFTEHVDLMPTLAELALGLNVPQCGSAAASFATAECTEGTSLVPLLTNSKTPIKNASFSQYPRPITGASATASWSAGAVSPCLIQNCTMGYTMVTTVAGFGEIRYTEWAEFNTLSVRHRPDWSTLRGAELYNHTADPGETVNIFSTAAPTLRAALSAALHAGPSAN